MDIEALKQLILESKNDTIAAIKLETEKINDTISVLSTTVQNLATRVTAIEQVNLNTTDKIYTNTNDIANASFEIKNLADSMHRLQNEYEKLNMSLDNQIDRGMRETLIINGIPGKEKIWEETKNILANTLETIDDSKKFSQDDYKKNIVRAHRGGKDGTSIYVKFTTSEMVNHVKSLRFKRGGLYINQMRSPIINGRILKGRNLIKTLKNTEGPQWKMYINDNIQLMAKKPGDITYSVYKQF